MATIRVPDVDRPTDTLCWRQEPLTFKRCDRRLHHEGLHSWEAWNRIQELERQLAFRLVDGRGAASRPTEKG